MKSYKVIHTLSYKGRVYRPGEIVEMDEDASSNVSFAVSVISKSSIVKEVEEEYQEELPTEQEAPKRKTKKKS